MRKRYWKKYFQMMGIAVGSTVGICQPTLLLAGDVSLSDDLSLSSALSVQYGGTETVDGNGYTIYGNNNSGYFVYSGSLTITDATLTGFTTTGGSGSGGGAGLGGAIFVNDGATVTLNNVSFGGNAAIGGVGGVGSTGGSLNNLFNSGTAGATGENGEDSAGGTSYVNGGNGGNGYNGADGGDGATGVGGAGGSGGDGSDGSAITADTIKSAVDLVYDAFMATGDGTAAGLYTAIAASFTAQAAAATAGGVTAGLAPGYTALAASFTTLAAEAGGVATEDLVKLAADTAYDIAITVTAFELGIAGNGGGAGNGGNGGNGAFGYGGGDWRQRRRRRRRRFHLQCRWRRGRRRWFRRQRRLWRRRRPGRVWRAARVPMATTQPMRRRTAQAATVVPAGFGAGNGSTADGFRQRGRRRRWFRIRRLHLCKFRRHAEH